ncbi:chaperonin 10-like protein [Ustulina deusta]|nr:chaperonin 10-like protein [Ustulina deusta]
MRALRYYGPKDVGLKKDFPEPKCDPTQVKVRPAFVGIFASDIHEYQTQTLIPKHGSPHALFKEAAPVILGYELSGTIVEIGSDVSSFANLKVGDRVSVCPLLYCRTCAACKDGFPNCCVNMDCRELSGGGGGLSDYVCVPPEVVFKLPDTLVEPLAVAWHAVNESSIKAGQAALVLSLSPIGLAVIQCLKVRNAGNIIAVGRAPRNQQFAKQFGATHILDPTRVHVIHLKPGANGWLGSPIAFDCAGGPSSPESMIRARSLLVVLLRTGLRFS